VQKKDFDRFYASLAQSYILHKNANMRTSLDIPDPLFRHLKSQAALEGSTLRDLVLTLLERGMNAPAPTRATPSATVTLPSISLGAPLALSSDTLNNAALFALLDD
jgi:hypothetical protein